MTSQTDSAATDSGNHSIAVQSHSLGFRWQQHQRALSFPDVTLNQGEHLFIHGASGTGKSTLLSLLAGMLQPASGQVRLLGTDLNPLSAGDRDRFRADYIGVIFQQFNLVPYLSALANVTLPCQLSMPRRAAAEPDPEQEAQRLLTALAIPDDHWHQKPGRLSIGQQQRVAAARALIGAPRLILADEPTSALDTGNRDRFLELLLTLAHRRNTSVLFVSHDPSLARHFHQQIELEGPAT